jgi:hypothetical protein
MVQAGNGARFALESLANFGCVRKSLIANLDRDDAIKAGIAGAEHFSHTPTPRGAAISWGPSLVPVA